MKAVVLNSHQLGHVQLDGRLVVPGNFIARCHANKPHAKKLIDILKTELEKKKLKLAHMKLNVGEVVLRNKIQFPKPLQITCFVYSLNSFEYCLGGGEA